MTSVPGTFDEFMKTYEKDQAGKELVYSYYIYGVKERQRYRDKDKRKRERQKAARLANPPEPKKRGRPRKTVTPPSLVFLPPSSEETVAAHQELHTPCPSS